MASPRNDFVDCHALRAHNDRPKTRLFQRPKNRLTIQVSCDKILMTEITIVR